MAFIYFFPKLDVLPEPSAFSEPLKKERLHLILGGESVTRRNGLGPDGVSGILAMVEGPGFSSTELNYDPKKQEWKKCGSSHWLGSWTDRPPTPDSLLRSKIIHGERVKLGPRGEHWTIPLTGPSGFGLPSSFGVGEDFDDWMPEAEDRFKSLMAMSQEVMAYLTDPSSDKIKNMKTGLQFASDLLCVNYRVSNREVGRLKLVTTENLQSILEAALGLELVRREEETVKEQASTDQNG